MVVYNEYNKSKEGNTMVKRMYLSITYKTGVKVNQLVNYLLEEEGLLYFTVDKQAAPIFQEPVKIPLSNIQGFSLEQILCDGWTPVDSSYKLGLVKKGEED